MHSAIDTKWFTDRLADKRMSQRQLAKHLGLDSSAVSLTFRGKRDMKLTEAAQIAQILSIPIDDVLHHAGVLTSSRGSMISVAGFLEVTGEVRCVSGTEESFSIPMPAGLTGDDYIAIQARTAGSDLEYMDGWVFYGKQPARMNAEAVGRMSFVHLKNGMRLIAHVKRGYRPDRYHLSGPVTASDAEVVAMQPIEHIKT
jgi:transcriptional regulator with XRE-family HTH domain